MIGECGLWSGAPRGDGGIQGHGDESTRLLQLQKRSVHFEFTISLTTASLFQPAPIQKRPTIRKESTHGCVQEKGEREKDLWGVGAGAGLRCNLRRSHTSSTSSSVKSSSL